MATAGAIVGLRVPGVEVEDIGTTAKTLPEFPRMWADMLEGERRLSSSSCFSSVEMRRAPAIRWESAEGSSRFATAS